MIQRSVVVVHRCLDGCDVEHSGYRDGVRVFVSFSQDRNRLISSISMILDFAYSSRAFIASDSVLQGDLLASVADDTGFAGCVSPSSPSSIGEALSMGMLRHEKKVGAASVVPAGVAEVEG